MNNETKTPDSNEKLKQSVPDDKLEARLQQFVNELEELVNK